jgi:hypothetical protein
MCSSSRLWFRQLNRTLRRRRQLSRPRKRVTVSTTTTTTCPRATRRPTTLFDMYLSGWAAACFLSYNGNIIQRIEWASQWPYRVWNELKSLLHPPSQSS